MTATVLVTGARGFIGRQVVTDLRRRGWTVRTAANTQAGPDDFRIPLSPTADWSEAVSGCEAVVHLAARAHVLHETADDPLTQFMLVNAEATRVLALASRAAGVRRFVFVSSIAVHGPMQGGPLRETDIPRPQSDYGRSKLAAERHLQDIVDGSPMDLTILRPPLVYGPGVGARFLQLIKWSESGLPLPLGGINNARSLLSVQNLSDAIAHCIENSASAGETFLVADDDAISTSELIRAIARRLKKPDRLITVPQRLLGVCACLLGRGEDFDRLVSSLVLDTSRIAGRLNWTPPIKLEAGLDQTIMWYCQRNKS